MDQNELKNSYQRFMEINLSLVNMTDAMRVELIQIEDNLRVAFPIEAKEGTLTHLLVTSGHPPRSSDEFILMQIASIFVAIGKSDPTLNL